jgi:hypothetical protein
MSLTVDELEKRLILLEGRVSQLQQRLLKFKPSKSSLKELRGTPELKNDCQLCGGRVTVLGSEGPRRCECYDSWFVPVYLPWVEANKLYHRAYVKRS